MNESYGLAQFISTNVAHADGVLTLKLFNRMWSRLAVQEKMMGYKDIEWDLAIDDAAEMVRG